MIGGNTIVYLKAKESVVNDIGENIPNLIDYMAIKGWLDLMNQSSERNSLLTEMAESTNIFLCDYVKIDKSIRDLVLVDSDDKTYDILYIDNPMGMNKQLEIYLKYVGE